MLLLLILAAVGLVRGYVIEEELSLWDTVEIYLGDCYHVDAYIESLDGLRLDVIINSASALDRTGKELLSGDDLGGYQAWFYCGDYNSKITIKNKDLILQNNIYFNATVVSREYKALEFEKLLDDAGLVASLLSNGVLMMCIGLCCCSCLITAIYACCIRRKVKAVVPHALLEEMDPAGQSA